jgi:hypothetical protein
MIWFGFVAVVAVDLRLTIPHKFSHHASAERVELAAMPSCILFCMWSTRSWMVLKKLNNKILMSEIIF